MAVTAPLARALAADRVRLNARVAQARQRHAGFDPDAFATFLRNAADPLIGAIEACDSARTIPVAGVVCDLALDLVAQGLAGPAARAPWLDRAWTALAPRLAPLIARCPAEALGALSNAVLNLATVPGVRIEEWLATMSELAAHTDSIPRLRALGAVCAWRAGMAHYREGALQLADELPAAIALRACGAAPDDDWTKLRQALQQQPWWNARSRSVQQEGREAGQFTGFGGSFAQPPQLRAGPQGFVVRSGERYFLLIADAHGAVLLPATAAEFERASVDPRVKLRGATLQLGTRRVALDLPADGLCAIANAHTVAITSPWTHSICLLPRAA